MAYYSSKGLCFGKSDKVKKEEENRKTTQYLILKLLAERSVSLKSLRIRLRVASKEIKRKDKNFCIVIPSIPKQEKINLSVLTNFWIRQGFINEEIRRRGKRKGRFLSITEEGEKSLSYLITRKKDGVGVNSTAKKLFNDSGANI